MSFHPADDFVERLAAPPVGEGQKEKRMCKVPVV